MQTSSQPSAEALPAGASKARGRTEPGGDAPTVVLEPRRAMDLGLAELWAYRELLLFLAWRDVKVRYKQTWFGVAWAVLQPALTMVIFSIIFGRIARLPTGGVPYPVFALTALIPWQLFSNAMSASSNSLVAGQALVKKVYFPRLAIPIASTLEGLVDFGVASVLLFGLLAYYGIMPGWRIATLPLFVGVAVLASLAVGLWLSALNVKYRDVRYTLPFLTQIWLFATPIAYASDLVPENWRLLYSLNPMVGVVEGFRWALLGQAAPLGGTFLVSLVAVCIVLFTGLLYFRRTERSFADLL